MKPHKLVFFAFLLATSFLIPLQSQPVQENDPIVGTYSWHNGNTVVIRADGTATSGENQGGRWVVNPYGGTGYVLMWEGGYVESVKLKANATRLEGAGLNSAGKAYSVTGTRKR